MSRTFWLKERYVCFATYSRILVISILLVWSFGMPSLVWSASMSAREIMQKVDDRDEGDNAIIDMEMILIDKNQKQRVRQMRSFRKDKGEDTQSVIFFLTPVSVKDTGFLSYDYDDPEKDDDQWLYLPALRKTKRVASSDKSDSFMGSDISYGDMTSTNLDDYDFTLMKEGMVKEHKVWQIQSVPRTQEVIDETGYTKSILFVRQDNFVVIRAVYWLKKGKRNKYFDVKKLELIDNVWIPTEFHMTTKSGKKTLHKTILKQRNIKFDQDLSDSFFTTRQLEKGL